MSEAPGQWPAVLQELLVPRQRAFPLRFPGYDRREVDEALRIADERLGGAVDECAALAELALALDSELGEARARMAEYDRLHAGDAVRHAEDESVRSLAEGARQEAETIIDEARQEARRAVERTEHLLQEKAKALEEAEREGRRRLAMATSMAGDVIREARRGCATLLAHLDARQQELDCRVREFSGLLDVLPSFRGTVEIPRSRKSEDAAAPRAGKAAGDPVAVETA